MPSLSIASHQEEGLSLRCLDAHAHLGNLAFDRPVTKKRIGHRPT